MAQEVEALFTNFDASVYTIIFIPADADGVLPPGAAKYLKQAREDNSLANTPVTLDILTSCRSSTY